MVFLDVFKAFDRVWHAGLLHKLSCLGISGKLHDWLKSYLSERKIRVVINGQTSDYLDTNAGVPQGSILGPLLFLVFINDITDNIESDIHLFADDTSLLDIIENHIASYAKLNRDLATLSNWALKWQVTFNANKTVYLQVSRKLNPAPKPNLILNGSNVKEVTNHKHLGLTFNNNFNWSDHISNLVTKSARCVGLLKRICRVVPQKCLMTIYISMIRPIMEYGDIIFDGSADKHLKRLENIQRQAALTCCGAYKHTNHDHLLDELGWPPLKTRRKNHRLTNMFKIQNNLTPPYLRDLCPPLTRERTTYDLRTGLNITEPTQRTSTYQKSFFPLSIKDWNALNPKIRNLPSINSFKEYFKKSSPFKIKPLYHHNCSSASINHTRIRLGLSGLSSQRHDYHHIPTSICPTCAARKEDPNHFFILCPTYSIPRQVFLQSICDILHHNNIDINFTSRAFRNLFINIILRGLPTLSVQTNIDIFNITQTFIKESHRFP
jgi:hypothetical protein